MKTRLQIFVLAFALVSLLAVAAYAEDTGAKTTMTTNEYGIPGSDNIGDATIYLGAMEPSGNNSWSGEKAAKNELSPVSYAVSGSDANSDATVYSGIPAAADTGAATIAGNPKVEDLNSENEPYSVPGDDWYNDSTVYSGGYGETLKSSSQRSEKGRD
jgi:hypothetical protein